jgi:signal transduction histidine kinase/ActR/RegA family two-component response regulator
MFVVQNHPDASYFFVAAGVSAFLAAFAWRRRAMPIAPAFAAMMLGQTAWSLGSGLELIFVDLKAKLICLDLMNLGIALTPPSLLFFVLRFTSRTSWLSPRNIALVLALPLVSLLVSWTNPWHHLYYREVRLEPFHGYWTGIEQRGPWFWVNVTYLYGLMAVSTAMLVFLALRSSGIYRAQVVLLLSGLLVPWIVNAVDLSGHSPVPQLDLTSMIFSVTGLTMVPALLRFRLLDLVPIARDVVIQVMRDAVIVLDQRARIADLNWAARGLLDRPDDGVIGEAAAQACQHWPRLAEAIEDLSERSIEIAGPHSGERSVFDLRISSLGGGDQRAGWVLVLRDVTERRRAEQERERLTMAESSGRAKDTFLAILSHELRTPLTPVLAVVSAMLDDNHHPALRPMLEMIRRNVELEARLIDDLLDVTRIGRGTLRLVPRTVDAHDVIREAVDICRGEIEESRITLELDLSASEHFVEADPARLQQIVWNLVKNATKFTLPGGTITVRSGNEDDLKPEGRPRLVIGVSDTGVGIEAEDLPRIFDVFEQGPVSPRPRSGLGLGLAISRSLTEAHGGLLTAFSPGPAQGSTFVLELPTVAAPSVAAKPPSESPEADRPHSSGLRILLVEDNKDTLMYLALVLEARGHKVTTAKRLSEALQAAAEHRFDLIVSDIELPDGSGLELMRQLNWRGQPAIALSGYGSEEDIRASRQAGFAEHLTKPVEISKLEETILQVASTSRSAPRGG